MSKRHDGEIYLTIGEVAKKVGRSTLTIKSWYDWAADKPDELAKLPKIEMLDERGTRYFNEKDVPKLQSFRDGIGYGDMAEFNRKRWGKRGSANV